MAPVRLIVIAIDLSLSLELEAIRMQVRTFVTDVIQPEEHRIEGNDAEGNKDGDEWVINGHKWFISGARRAQFAILVCRTEENPDIPQAANSAFIIELLHEGWNDVREGETMHGGTGRSEIVITDLRVHNDQMLGGRSQGRVIDRSIQVHSALGYSTDTPLAHMYQHARWARFADGADGVHQMRLAQRTIAASTDEGSTRRATGNLPI